MSYPTFSPRSAYLCIVGIAVCLIHPFPSVEGRSARILTGHVPVNDEPVNGTGIFPAESDPPASYIVPPPAFNPSVTVSRFTPEDAKLFVPKSVPSIENHRLSGNWSQELSKNEVQITSVIKQQVVPVTTQGSKVRRKVDVEKFRECVFFRVCKKAECFHYGRFGTCKTKRID